MVTNLNNHALGYIDKAFKLIGMRKNSTNWLAEIRDTENIQVWCTAQWRNIRKYNLLYEHKTKNI